MNATTLLYGQIAIIAQIPVAKIKIISTRASMLFRKPNCRGVNKKLKTKFTQKGRAVFQLIFPVLTNIKTHTLAAKIMGYKTPQTLPKAISGGAQEGFLIL